MCVVCGLPFVWLVVLLSADLIVNPTVHSCICVCVCVAELVDVFV